MEGWLNDLRFAVRSLRRTPGITAVAVAALAVGIGANATIFSLANAVLLRPLPYPAAERLVLLVGNVQRQVVERRGGSYPDFIDWRRESRSFTDVAAYWAVDASLVGAGEAERLEGEIVSPAYFTVLGIDAAQGRVFTPEEEAGIAGAPVVLVSHGLWTRRFGQDPGLVGRPLQLGSFRATVVGVLPPDFHGLTDQAEYWLPTGALPQLEQIAARRGARWLTAVARLRPAVSVEQAQSEMDALSRRLEQLYPDTNEARGVEVVRVSDELTRDLRPSLLALLGAVAFVLLIACTNVAALLLTRTEARQREMAVRAALGASRTRLLRLLVAEGLVLSAAGGALGGLLALWGPQALIAVSPAQFPSFVVPQPDRTVAFATAALVALVGVGIGLAPALQASSGSLAATLRQASARGASSARQRLRSGLVVAEVALSVVLLVGAGLLIASLRERLAVDPGFEAQGLLALRVSYEEPEPAVASPAPGELASPAPGTRPISARTVLERLSALPGVREAALGTSLPLTGGGSAIFYSAEGRAVGRAQTQPRAYVHRVTPGFFRTLGIPLLQGRDFAEGEPPSSVIVSENLARRFWPGENPIGRRIGPGRVQREEDWSTIVGVVAETRYRSLPRNPTADPDLFLPFRPDASTFSVFLRTSLPPQDLVASARTALAELDPTATIFDAAPVADRVAAQAAAARFVAWLTGVFAAVALVLAALGVYGVIASLVTQRRREIGVRVAIGALPDDLARLVLGRGLRLTLAGAVVGLAGALATSRLLGSLLYGVTATDPGTYAGVLGLLVGVALLAAWLPARRAMRVDPVVVLREE